MRSTTYYNIEFAHIYADRDFSSEQIKSVENLKNLMKKLKQQKENFVTSVLIDDYNSKSHSLDESNFVHTIKSYAVPVDFIAYESKLNLLADRVIEDLPKSILETRFSSDTLDKAIILKTEGRSIKLRDYFESSVKNTCALLTACWLLCRLGIYVIPENGIRRLNTRSFEGNNIITILPKKYEYNEYKALAIIRALGRKELLKKIEYIFF